MYVFMYTSLKNSGVAKTFIKAEDGLFDLKMQTYFTKHKKVLGGELYHRPLFRKF